VEPEAQEHADQVLEKNVKKVCKNAFSNTHLQVVNVYMKRRGYSINNFRQYSDVYLNVDQYIEVKNLI
jgi:NADPH-dependent 7-cyano-7-deazaguanine reductase QueF